MEYKLGQQKNVRFIVEILSIKFFLINVYKRASANNYSEWE